MLQKNGTRPSERILIVDDDDVTRRLASHIFEKAGYEVVTAENGISGIRLVDTFHPDLLILDVMMPDLSGLEVCERIRSDPATAWLPIIMLSAKSSVDDKLDGFQAGADDYVAKPVSHKELLARAGALLARARRNQPSKASVIAAVGVKGGVGVTTVMTNVAVQLASQDNSVLLIELRSTRGTLGHNLGLTPAEDLGGLLLRSPADIRPADVMRRVVRHKSGVKVLTGPSSVADYVISEAHAHIILEALVTQTEYLLLDLPSVTAGGIQLALEQADQILLVLEPETISVSRARADLEVLKAWGLFDRTTLMIVSRARSSNLIAPKDIEKELDVEVIGALPPSPEVFYLAAKLANPVVVSKPDSLAATTLVKLTRALQERLPTVSPVRVR
jgi:DNA-binding response OmpR family regulator